MKKPWVAALLNLIPGLFVFMSLLGLGNFIPLGLGYLYLGRRRRFVPVFLLWLLTVLGPFVIEGFLELGGKAFVLVPAAGITAYDAIRLTASSPTEPEIKSPTAAALLNLVLIGLGYLYLGRRRRFIATSLTAATAVSALGTAVIIAFSCFYETHGEVICGEGARNTILIVGAISSSVLLLLVVFAVPDAARLARRHNELASQSEPGHSTQPP